MDWLLDTDMQRSDQLASLEADHGRRSMTASLGLVSTLLDCPDPETCRGTGSAACPTVLLRSLASGWLNPARLARSG